MKDRIKEIHESAYLLWEHCDKPVGFDLDFYIIAERAHSFKADYHEWYWIKMKCKQVTNKK